MPITRSIALLRGINVGKAKRIAMADLRDVFEELGFSKVGTLLNSGNVVFSAPASNPAKAARAIEAAIVERFKFFAAVVVITSRELDAIIAGNALLQPAHDHSRFLVAFVASPEALVRVRTLAAQSWAPDALTVTDRAAYLWCANGLIESKLMKAFSRVAGDGVTTRNWATVLKLQAAAKDEPGRSA